MNKYFVMILFALLLLTVPSCGKKQKENISPSPVVSGTEEIPSQKTVREEAGTEKAVITEAEDEDVEVPSDVPVIPEDGEKRYEDNIFYTYSSTLEGFVLTANAVTYARSILIPDEIDGITVVGIGDYAFSGNGYITGCLTIPAGVKSIGKGAFSDCTSLTGLWISEGVESIGEEAFLGCRALSGDLFIPESVTEIGNRAFRRCGFDGSLHILGAAAIGDEAFCYTGFTGELHILNAVSIGNCAFCGCNGFTGELILPESVKSVGVKAFRGCSGFSGDLILPSSVRTVGEYAFASCTGFDGILILSSSFETIGEGVFCDTEFSCDVIIPESVKSIESKAFVGSHITPYFTSACIELASDAFTPGTVIPPELL